jgi:hypothetical protein
MAQEKDGYLFFQMTAKTSCTPVLHFCAEEESTFTIKKYAIAIIWKANGGLIIETFGGSRFCVCGVTYEELKSALMDKN